MWWMLPIAVAEAPAVAVSAPAPDAVGATRAVAGFGIAVGGGGLLGFSAAFRLNGDLWLDAATSWRAAAGGFDDYLRRSFMVGVYQSIGTGIARPGWYAKVGTTLPGEYVDAFVTGGFHLTLTDRRERHAWTFQAGPGVFVVRQIPGVDPGPPLLWYGRIGWTRNVIRPL